MSQNNSDNNNDMMINNDNDNITLKHDSGDVTADKSSNMTANKNNNMMSAKKCNDQQLQWHDIIHPTKQDESLAQAPMNQAEIPLLQVETLPTRQNKTTKAKMPTMTQAETSEGAFM